MTVVIYYHRSDLLSVAFLVWQGPLGARELRRTVRVRNIMRIETSPPTSSEAANCPCRSVLREFKGMAGAIFGDKFGESLGGTLRTHTPQIWGVEIHPPNLGGESSKSTCFTVFSGARSLNLGGEIFTPRIWGVWVLRGVRLPRASGKFPGFPGSSPNFPGSFSATSPEVLSLWN